jgi:hypothetical protein
MESDRITRAATATAPDKGPRPAKANAFKQALARAMEGAGPDAPPARPQRSATARAQGQAASTASAALMLQAGRGTPVRRADPFRDRIAAAEGSRELYGVRNPVSGALGRYQFVPQALQDLGWKDSGGTWTALAATHGVTSDEQFLANPAAQESAMTTYLARTEQQLSRNGALAQAGGSVQGLDGGAVPLTEAGLMAAAHRRGAGSVARYLAHRANTPDAALSPQQRQAFASVERRLRDFSEMPYAMASRRGGGTPAA